ncbi:MAG: gamma-glutamyl-gamma-aminobutyrate hydrolase family protein [Sphingomicrobium sp.]
MSARPVIGIVCCARSVGQEIAQVVVERYLTGVMTHADCAALLIPARPDLMTAREVAGRIDGLLLTGSPSNMVPALYDDDLPGDGPFDRNRDDMSLALIEALIERARPVFGICRGFQELNVAFGGTLARDLGGAERPIPHHAPDGASLSGMFGHEHDVALAADGVLAKTFKRDRLRVNSVHYQGVGRLGDGLAVEATAPDGVIEAFSSAPGGAAVLGVQWHPEWQTESDATSVSFFNLFGRAVRGDTGPWNREAAA